MYVTMIALKIENTINTSVPCILHIKSGIETGLSRI